MEGTNTRNGDGRRLVLGFDARCMTCNGLARSIEEAVGAKLELRSLTDPQVEHWREQALGMLPGLRRFLRSNLAASKPGPGAAWA